MAFEPFDSLFSGTQRLILDILLEVENEPLTAAKIAELGEIPDASLYRAMSDLIKCGLVEKPKPGKPARYSLNRISIPFLKMIKAASESENLEGLFRMFEEFISMTTDVRRLSSEIAVIQTKVKLSYLDKLKLERLRKERREQLVLIARKFGGQNSASFAR